MVIWYPHSTFFLYRTVEQVLRIAVDRAQNWWGNVKLIALKTLSDIEEVQWPHTCRSMRKPTVCTLISASVLCNGSQIVQAKVNIWQYSTHSWWMKRSIDSWLIPKCLSSLCQSNYTVAVLKIKWYNCLKDIAATG